eukprot:809176-Pleurochrysis_carterae.AAC.1
MLGITCVSQACKLWSKLRSFETRTDIVSAAAWCNANAECTAFVIADVPQGAHPPFAHCSRAAWCMLLADDVAFDHPHVIRGE